MKYEKGLRGLNDAIKYINEQIAGIKDATRAAQWEAALKVINLSMKRAPADTGNLRGSAYVRSAQRSEKIGTGEVEDSNMPTDTLPDFAVEFGYYAHYALNVHEMVEQKLKGRPRAHFGTTREGVDFGGGTGKGTYWDTGEPKFLESVVTENRDRIVEIVRERTRKDVESRAAQERDK